jgi:DNA ligase 1
MTNFVSVIKACEQANGAGSKAVIAAALATLDDVGRRLVDAALNSYRVYGIKKFKRGPIENYAKYDSQDFTRFFEVLQKLEKRELTGDAARTTWAETLMDFTVETASYLERVVDKDLKAGFSAETFNKVVLAIGTPGSFEANLKIVDKAIKTGGYESFKNNENYSFIVPVYACQLADKCESTDEFEQYVTFPCQADFKYDGERTQAFVRGTEVTYLNRSGLEATHCAGLFDEELIKIRNHVGYDFVLDGERCSDNGFIDTVNAKKSGNEEAKANLRFRAFFLMPLSHWMAQKTDITTRVNRAALTQLIADLDLRKIILTEGREVSDYQDMMSFCNEAIDKPENAARKIEGLILKDWDAVYEWDRTFAWTKVKRFYDVDCRIVGFYAGKEKSRLANTLGGIEVIGFLEDGTEVRTRVGSGFSDDLRAAIWNNREVWMSKTVVIKYQEVSKAKNKEFASLRFPTFERDRDDKLVEI